MTAAGTGVLLNNEMDDFSAKPGVLALKLGELRGQFAFRWHRDYLPAISEKQSPP